MITVFHRGDATEIIATLNRLGIAFTDYNLAREDLDAGARWAAGLHLIDVGRAEQTLDGTLKLLTPTTTISNGLGRAVIAGDHPETVLAKLTPVDQAPVHEMEHLGAHRREPDGRCSCKTGAGAQVLAAAKLTDTSVIDLELGTHDRDAAGAV